MSEHRVITCSLTQLKASARKFETANQFSTVTLLTQLTELLSEHLRIEERLLFPMLSRCLGSHICDKLRDENAEIINVSKKLGVQRPFQESFSRLEQLLRAHSSTEENVLFWYLEIQQTNELKLRNSL